VKKQLNISYLLALLLIGYSCQIARFQTAALQYEAHKSCPKLLTKRVFACFGNRSENDKKQFAFKKQSKQKNVYNDLFLASFPYPDPTVTTHSVCTADLFYSFKAFSCSSGKRGPPLFS
jgi:hypothetical protein